MTFILSLDEITESIFQVKKGFGKGLLMGSNKSTKQLAKFLSYVLGRRPDEFGLVPDQDGFVKLKELIQAVNEEEGFRHIRRALVDELIITQPDSPIEIIDNQIRAIDRESLKPVQPEDSLPKLLYVAVTQKSYPIVSEEGIGPTYFSQVILSTDEKMALRIGKRRDSSPIVLTINVQQSKKAGITFLKAGDLLVLADTIPVGCFSGPPLPKQKIDTHKQEKQADIEKQRMAGSFLMDIANKNGKEDKTASWKRDKRRLRRQKQKKWPT